EFFVLPLFSLLFAYFKIDILRENFPHTRHGKAAGCVSNLSLHRSQRPTLSIIQKTQVNCNTK
ncbi:hypothetical protein V7149_13605, partial [Bacillus sp. JJ1503]|uniref:hypothetical protein n=1 Tax=Bacillus sp. JJ1503 TaxID=3122956 RepID=UPI002FFF3D6A